MRIAVDYGRERQELEIADNNLLGAPVPSAPPLADPAAAVRAALEAPFGFPALRRALTPDDHVAVVVDETLPRLGLALTAILDHVTGAGVPAENVTLLCAPSPSSQPWLDELPDAYQEARVEIHDPADRNRLSYLATTRADKRLYLNRTLVDADQIVVLSGRRYDAVLGYAGGAGEMYPALSDVATRRAADERVNLAAPGAERWPAHAEAAETSWLLGAPFFVQIIQGAGDDWAHVVAGSVEALAEAERLLDERWRRTVTGLADVVIAGVSGDPQRHTFADLAAAAANAARVVQPNGRVVVLSQANPAFDAAAEAVLDAAEPHAQAKRLRKQPSLATLPALRWADAAERARLYLLSGWPDDKVEELFATPLEKAAQAQRLIDAGGSCLVLADAHKTLAVVREE